ncbi:hypothetical protein SLEP1_g1218 [Rubroshorea leprosula]|uniref:Uncharacterized protein n=1 Tax=Rubroshorea leprosula TaxID=152421 RepID=A0AAV5HM71_9ROSI|nr:hypothetical protein SLEP1_g1218 [Rubroshorea leprosula]
MNHLHLPARLYEEDYPSGLVVWIRRNLWGLLFEYGFLVC